MILTRRKSYTVKQIKNGTWNVIIQSMNENTESLIIVFKCGRDQIYLVMPINNKIHALLCDIMTYCDIKTFTRLNQFIGCKLSIEVIDNKVKYISRYKIIKL